MANVENNQQVPEIDIKERTEGFSKELQALCGKYEINLASIAQIVPDGRIGSQVILVSSRGKEKPTPSPKPESDLARVE